MADLLLGVDIGTSSMKTVLYEAASGRALAAAAREYPTEFPCPGGAEQDAERWWTAVAETCREVLHGGESSRVAALGVGGQGWTCLPVDAAGRPLRQAMLWLDRRSEEPCRFLREQVGEERIFRLAGNRVDPAYVTPKILWLKRHEPALFARTKYFLSSTGYVNWRLCGVAALERSAGYGHYHFAIARAAWDEKFAAELGVPPEKLPPLRDGPEVLGGVTAAAAAATGLRPGTPVVAGGLDAACAALGAGVVAPGQTQDQGGTAGGMSIYVAQPHFEPLLILGCHAIPGAWLLQGGTVGGAALRWFRDALGQYEQERARAAGGDAYRLLDEEAGRAPPGARGLIFVPYLAGERSPIWDSQAKGLWLGLTYAHRKPELVRAILEGCALALKHNIALALEKGAVVTELIGVGGAARSPLWCQIKADAVGRPLLVPENPEGTPLGAALLAGLGAGLFPDAAAAAAALIRIVRRHDPDPGRHALYEELFAVYRGLYPKLRGEFQALDALGRR